MKKRTGKNFNSFRYFGNLQKRIEYRNRGNIIEDYKNGENIFCDIKIMSANELASQETRRLDAEYKITTRNQGLSVDVGDRLVFVSRLEIYRVSNFYDKTGRREYLTLEARVGVYTNKSTTQPQPPCIYAKVPLLSGETIEEKLVEGNSLEEHSEIGHFDGYSDPEDIEFINEADNPVSLCLVFDPDFLDASQVATHFSGVASVVKGFHVIKLPNPITNYLSES